ncbi:MAG: NUDIX hydrolase [Clostridiales bacterium]|jgi:ADP-ribose pyrophosphatase|nr:NUDIX hydrolase [Clostridiales bacterium]
MEQKSGKERPYQVVSSNIVFRGKILNIKHDLITAPDGGEMLREVVISHEAAAVVPVNEKGDIIFVRQYRHPAGKLVLEIPAGIIEEGEKPTDCAIRELREETGHNAVNIRYISGFHSTIGFCTEVIHLFIADCVIGGSQKLDADEFVSVEIYTPQKALEMIKNGEIFDGKTIAGVLFYCREKGI